MCEHLDKAEQAYAEGSTLDRRTLVLGAGATLAAAGLAGSLMRPGSAAAHDPSAGQSATPAAPAAAGPSVLLETVTGPVSSASISWALAHEHFFVDFFLPSDPKYMDVNWSDVTGACTASANDLRAQGVDLFIDWTNMGVGRNPLLLRDVSRRSGMNILCATGIYKNRIPPALVGAPIGEIADHFYRELTKGIGETPIRAGWVKCATTEDGPTAADTRVHAAAARAAKRAGCTISLHSPHYEATKAVMKTLEGEGFDLRRFVWGHSQVSSVEDHKKVAAKGAMVQWDAISASKDEFFGGPTDDESMLDRIQEMIAAGYGDRIVVSADASVFVNPAIYQYDRQNTYVYRTFVPKLKERIGDQRTQMVLRDNVVKAFRRGDNVS